VGAHVGQASLGDQPVGAESAQLWVSVDPGADYGATVRAVRAVVSGYPGIRHRLETATQDRLRHGLGTGGSPLTVRVFGEALDVLRQKADEVQQVLAGIDGVRDAQVDAPPQEPTMEVEVDLAKAQQLGIKPGDVRRAAEVLLSGLQVGSLFEQQKVFDVRVWSTPESRRSLTSVQNLLLDTPDGGHVRLLDVATVRVRPTLPSIQHEDVSRYLDVQASISGRAAVDVERDVRKAMATVAFPLEYHATLLGDHAAQRDDERRVLFLAIGAAVGIFLLLQAATSSWRLAFITAASLPVAVAGGLVAAWIDGGPVTVAFVAGMLALLALATRHALLLVDQYQRLRRMGESFATTANRGASDRFAPVLVSAVAVAAMVGPAIFLGDVAGLEVLHGMAVVIVGGLVTTTFVSLFVLPALYARFGPRREPEPLRLDREPVARGEELAGVG
jgi:Cu/Ag efflux pump CusA